MGSKHIHTTAYHPQANGMIERWHRSFKAAMICYPNTPWPERLPVVLLGLQTCFKEDLNSSAGKRLGKWIFWRHRCKPRSFQLWKIFPAQAAHHSNKTSFRLKETDKWIQAFIRKHPLEPPYTGPFKVVYRNNDRVFTLNINGKEVKVSVDRIKSAFILKSDAQLDFQTESCGKPRTYEKEKSDS